MGVGEGGGEGGVGGGGGGEGFGGGCGGGGGVGEGGGGGGGGGGRDSPERVSFYDAQGRLVLEQMFYSTGNNPICYGTSVTVSYTHLRAHETVLDLVCRLLLESKNHSHFNVPVCASLTSDRIVTNIIHRLQLLVCLCLG